MAEKRKLMAEMERVFRKVPKKANPFTKKGENGSPLEVDEGVELFQDIMLKMGEANSDNQREKFQDDLKKEIKKLQRLRDQIKGWQNSSEIKDKDRLGDYRKHIEKHMEMFKDIERENKTKPHSKQGLSAEEKLDPRERERGEVIEFLQSCIAQLNEQSELLEGELENLGALGGGGRRRKGQTDRGKQRAEEEGRHRLDRHKYHVRHLELIMRLLNNETLETAQVKEIKDDIEDYINRNQEDDFQENEYIYEDLNMGEMAQQLGSVTNIGTFEEPDADSDNEVDRQSDASPEPQAKEEEAKARHASGPTDASKSSPGTPLRLTSQGSVETAANGALGRSTSPPSTPGILYAKAAGAKTETAAGGLPSGLPSGPTPLIPPANHHLLYNAGVLETVGARPEADQGSDAPPSPTKLPHSHAHSHGATPNGLSDSGVPALKSIAEQAMAAGVDLEQLRGRGFLAGAESSGAGREQRAATQEALILPIQGASPLGKEPITAEHKAALTLLEAATSRLPLPMDSERLRPYLSRQPMKQPPYYVQTPPPLSDTLEYFNRLTPDTLFFIFYYMEGTKAQYLAAKALKKQSWRFHKKYMMWFQRHEDPTAITDDYEQGTYVYFDFEKWAQRKKESFTFEYQYLEDRDLS